ncbi:Ig-like domain-containing protein [Longimicrobium sp.]|uniref:Ig-like domain-containing protein n=1 Tax=Longimicrobium sp. TaxID=2029185 RepID=UPI003B3B5EE2
MPAPWIHRLLAASLLLLAACADDVPSATPPDDALAARQTGVQLVLVSGGAQVGVPGHALAEPVVVRVLDRRGTPVAGARVNFLAEAGGLAEPRQTDTDADGYARTTWTLLARGAQKLRASGVGGTVPVTATAQPGNGSTLTLVRMAGDGQRGTAGMRLPEDLQVRLLRDDGTAVARAPVTWRVTAGGGRVNSALTATTGAGDARVRWTLGAEPGVHTVVASTPGADSVVFTATVPGTPVPKPATLHLEPDSLVLDVGQTDRFTAVVRDQNGAKLPGHTPQWSTSDCVVAAVDAEGNVRGIAIGTAAVTARVGALTASATVRVRGRFPSLEISPDSLVLDIGVWGRLFPVARDASGEAIVDYRVEWSSLADGVVLVDGGGNLLPVAAGTARIVARWGTLADTTTVRVRPARGALTIPQVQKRVASYGGSIDPSRGSVELNWWLHVSQYQVSTMSMRVRSPLGRTIDCTNMDAESWSRNEFRCRLTLPRGSEPGTWRVDRVTVTRDGQTTVFEDADLVAMGTLGRQFDVLGTGADTQPPLVRVLWPNQGTRYPDRYYLDVGTVDHVSGVRATRITVRGPGGVTHSCQATHSYGALAKVGGGVCLLPLRPGSGTWDVVSVEVEDGAGNRATYTPEQIAQSRAASEAPFLVFSFTP